MNGTTVIGALALLFLVSCGLFSVRDTEPPLLSPRTEDPLGFSGLLSGTSERFDRLHYDELFAAEFVYRQGTSVPHSRNELITRLRTIESTYPGAVVEWVRTDSVVFSRIENYTVELDSTLYFVYLSGNRSSLPDFSGYADIGLRYVGYWTITHWYDFPSPTPTGYSFFNPDFRSLP